MGLVGWQVGVMVDVAVYIVVICYPNKKCTYIGEGNSSTHQLEGTPGAHTPTFVVVKRGCTHQQEQKARDDMIHST